MAEFGQTAPTLPQIYWNQTSFQFTKAGLASHLCRALATVGMIPLSKWWPYDALDPANAEFVGTVDTNNSTHIFAFDFPDASTFTIDNELWRPFIAVVAHYGQLGSVAGSNFSFRDTLLVELGIRRDGATSMTDTRGRYRAFTGNNFGWGLVSEALTVVGGSTTAFSSGTLIIKADWKPWASSVTGTDLSLLSVSNIFVYLGPAGLFVYLGTGNTKTQFGSIMAAGFAFGGARLPERGADVDPNLGRINPIIHLPMRETAGQILLGASSLRSQAQGIQHDLKSTLNWYYQDLWNLENAETPFYSDRRANTVPSPRRLSSGQGAHILGRIVAIPKEDFTTTSTLYGPIVPTISASDTRPSFAEVFHTPKCRFADLTAPLGDYQDPFTTLNWRIVPHPASGVQLALYSENKQEVSALTVGTKTLLETALYDLTSTTQTGTGAFPVGSPVTVTSVPSGRNAAVAHLTIPAAASTSRWVSAAATDILSCDMTAFTGNAALTIEWSLTVPVTDPEDSLYSIEFDCRVRGGAEDTNNLSITYDINNSAFTASISDGTTARAALATSGANAAHYAFDYKTYSFGLPRNNFVTGSPIVFRFIANRTNASDATVIEIKSIKLKRFRYV